jgi:hypothetical protein
MDRREYFDRLHILSIDLTLCRFFPGGKAAPNDQIVLYKSNFTLLAEEVKCSKNTYLRTREKAPNGTYSCYLEVNHVLYENQTDGRKTWGFGSCLSGVQGWPLPPPPCLIQTKVDYNVMYLSEFKDTYWR